MTTKGHCTTAMGPGDCLHPIIISLLQYLGTVLQYLSIVIYGI